MIPKSTSDKFVVYQMMFHLWGNKNTQLKMNGSLTENGVTKFEDVSTKGLKALKKKGGLFSMPKMKNVLRSLSHLAVMLLFSAWMKIIQ